MVFSLPSRTSTRTTENYTILLPIRTQLLMQLYAVNRDCWVLTQLSVLNAAILSFITILAVIATAHHVSPFPERFGLITVVRKLLTPHIITWFLPSLSSLTISSMPINLCFIHSSTRSYQKHYSNSRGMKSSSEPPRASFKSFTLGGKR